MPLSGARVLPYAQEHAVFVALILRQNKIAICVFIDKMAGVIVVEFWPHKPPDLVVVGSVNEL